MRKMVYSIERNYDGAYIVRGIIGRRYYLYYTKREAQKHYCDLCRRAIGRGLGNGT